MPASGGAAMRVAAAFTLLFAATLVPLLSVALPPLVDYPNHLARMDILADGGASPLLARYYAIHWALLPNLAMDAVVPALMHVLPRLVAGRVFLGFLLLFMAGGMLLLHRALWGRWSLWPCLGFLLLYNRIFLWGFVNFLFGLGLAFCAAALWVSLPRRLWPLRLVVNTLAATLVFFCHIEAQAILFLIVLGLEGGPALAELRGGRWRALGLRIVLAALPFVPAAAIFIASWQHRAGGGAWVLSDPIEKLQLLLTIFGNYRIAVDLACSVLFLALFVGLGLRGKLSAARPLGWWLVITVATFVFLPNVLFTGASADHRLPLVIAMLLIAGTAPKDWSRRGAVCCVLVVGAVFALRLGLIEQVWLRSATLYRDDIATLARLPAGSRLGVADPWSILHDVDVPEVHIPLLAIPMRQAFVPPLFAYPAQQPVLLRGPWRDLEARSKPDRLWAAFVEGDKAVRARLGPAIAQYDYILFVYLAPFRVPPDPCLRFVQGSPTFQLFKVLPSGGTCPGL